MDIVDSRAALEEAEIARRRHVIELRVVLFLLPSCCPNFFFILCRTCVLCERVVLDLKVGASTN